MKYEHLQNVPPVIDKAVRFAGGKEGCDVAFAPRGECSRSAAWRAIHSWPPSQACSHNPWRKAHTEDFWVWFTAGGFKLLPTVTP